MAQAAARLADDADVRALAERMVRNQPAEINEYRGAAQAASYDIAIDPPPCRHLVIRVAHDVVERRTVLPACSVSLTSLRSGLGRCGLGPRR
jgi:hypothetical protein